MASDNRNRGYGDGKHTRMIGVRDRGRTVEIKKWHEGVNFYKDVKCSEEEAGMMHDLARVCSDPTVDPKRLNTPELERRIIRQDYSELTTNGDRSLDIDKTPLNSREFLTDFLGRHPVRCVVGTPKEQADAMTKDVVKLAPLALSELKDKIASEHSSRRGRQRTDLHEIHPVVQDDDFQELMDTIEASNEVLKKWRGELEEKDKALKEALKQKDEALKQKDEALKQKDEALKSKDAELKAKGPDEIEALKMKLYINAVRARAANVTPSKRGFAEREGFIIQNAVEYNDPPEDSKEKIKRLESQIASMKVTHAEELKALKEELTTERDPIGRHEHFSNVDWIENIDWRVMTAGQQSTD